MRAWLRNFLILLACAFTAIALGTLVPRPLFAGSGSAEREILVLSTTIHTDIAIPVDASSRSKFSFLEAAGVPLSHPDARWIVFGWGGRSFYTETASLLEIKVLPLLKAITIDRSVMHVEIVGEIPMNNPQIARLAISSEGLTALSDFIGQSFERDASGQAVVLPNAGFGAGDRFFEATGYFNAVVGCNTWTAAGLRKAGLQTGFWNPLPVLLDQSISLFNAAPP